MLATIALLPTTIRPRSLASVLAPPTQTRAEREPAARREPLFLVDYRRVGGCSFLKLGRLSLSWSVGKRFKRIGER